MATPVYALKTQLGHAELGFRPRAGGSHGGSFPPPSNSLMSLKAMVQPSMGTGHPQHGEERCPFLQPQHPCSLEGKNPAHTPIWLAVQEV